MALAEIQSQIGGIPQTGVNFFPYPPYVAFFFGLFSFLPYSLAFVIWTVLSILCFATTAALIVRYLSPVLLKQWGVTALYLVTIVFSFYPTIFGLQNGQNHAWSLFLVTSTAIFSLVKSETWAGVMAGLLLFKPQLLLGWLLLWFVLGRKRTLFIFALTGTLILSTSILHKGIAPYIAWVEFFQNDIKAFTWGSPWEVSFTAFFSRIAKFYSNSNLIVPLTVFLSFVGVILTMALMIRRKVDNHLYYLHALAILAPFLVIPHLLYYDLVLLIPFFVIWSNALQSRLMLYVIIITYIAGIILPILCEVVDFPLMGAIPLFLVIEMITTGIMRSTESLKTKSGSGIFPIKIGSG